MERIFTETTVSDSNISIADDKEFIALHRLWMGDYLDSFVKL